VIIQGINNTSNDTFRRLFGNGLTYQIPKHQRDYSWESEQWSDLWYDVKQAREEGRTHYMGYLVLLHTLKSVCVDDSEFEQSFAVKEFRNSNRNNKLVRYILTQIEKSESGASVDPDELTLEHILPESPPTETWSLDDATINQWKYRLGNLTLTEEWGPSEIEKQQTILAKLAKGAWRVTI
jgi:hypothetical protein